jgi:hypothetical protein
MMVSLQKEYTFDGSLIKRILKNRNTLHSQIFSSEDFIVGNDYLQIRQIKANWLTTSCIGTAFQNTSLKER